MSLAPNPQQIAQDARWLAQALDPAAGLVRLIAMTPDSYRAAGFLDDRMLQQPMQAHLLSWKDVAAAVAPSSRDDARWIFHIGHVGSTLILRLLGELDDVLAIREPRLLRDVAMLPSSDRAGFFKPLRKLYSRTFSPGQTAVVKATSFVSEIAHQLIPDGGRALFLFAQPRAYIQSILAGETSLRNLRALRESRADRMKSRVPSLKVTATSDAHLAAAAWACEITSLQEAADASAKGTVLWADFDAMLTDMATWLGRVTDFLKLKAEPAALKAIASGPLMGRYSKALEYEYSPQLRRDLLDEAGRHHRRDIDHAMGLLNDAAGRSPILQRALASTGAEI